MMTKADIIKRGLELGLDYSLTHSCYDPGPAGPCGRCDSCVLRATASRRPASPIPPCADDRAHLLHRAGMPLVRRRRHRASSSMRGARIVLDRTAFYPTSGGQPFDTGRLGTTDVVDTVDEDERVCTWCGRRSRRARRVQGEIDWARRFDHMQQHTGQHVLSAAFDRLLENRTMSFHMGGESSTIDLAREVSPADVERAVDEANRIVWEDRPVTIRFASADEAARLPLRKEPVREGPLRLIEVRDFDLSACGGTHVARTGEIGILR